MTKLDIAVHPKYRSKFVLLCAMTSPKAIKNIDDNNYHVYYDKDITEKTIQRKCLASKFPAKYIKISKIDWIPNCLTD